MAKEKAEKVKKPIYKKWWFWAIVVVLIFSAFGSGGKDKETEDTTATEQTEQTTEATAEEAEATAETITLIAGEAGEYGKKITMNEGTDMPEELIVYYLPAGDYTIKNIGEYPTQVNVYEGFERDESTGYDNYTDGNSTPMIDVDKTADINVPEGWFMEIHEPTKIELVKK